ncbi:MAG: Crp/Fnr family transcriptional regulator [Candidatus Gottesmanbacteria bacterium]|nr:Crp/Fnr family transcriptional regulator [Candidatus Gottesmanbacteria bacterium]
MTDTVKRKVIDFFTAHPLLLYKKGEMILRADDTPHGVCYIEKGIVRQYSINGAGETLMLQFYRPGAFFPMTWVINDIPNRYFFEAATAVSIRRAPREAVKTFIDDQPEVLKDFVERLLLGVSGLWLRIEHLVLESAYVKTILLILYYAEKFGVKDAKGVALEVSPTHKEISAWIGTTRETASLQVEALKKKKLLVSRGRQLVIPSMTALEKELSSVRPDRSLQK